MEYYTIEELWDRLDEGIFPTEEEAIEQFRIRYCSLAVWKGKPHLNHQFCEADGYLSVIRIPKAHEFTITINR